MNPICHFLYEVTTPVFISDQIWRWFLIQIWCKLKTWIRTQISGSSAVHLCYICIVTNLHISHVPIIKTYAISSTLNHNKMMGILLLDLQGMSFFQPIPLTPFLSPWLRNPSHSVHPICICRSLRATWSLYQMSICLYLIRIILTKFVFRLMILGIIILISNLFLNFHVPVQLGIGFLSFDLEPREFT